MSGGTEWIAVDWGTSNLRVWGIDADGAVTFANSSDKGMGKLERAAFPASLSDVLAGHLEPRADPYDVLIAGMAGARQGWMEAPYVEAPADLDALLASAVRPEMPDPHLSPRILPGVCQRGQGAEDVMRGEETQLLGLSALLEGFSGTVVMPGTHSKWAELDGRTVRRFATAMTGELFEVLKTHSVLRHSVGGDPADPERNEGFDAGLDTGLARPEKLVSDLFRVRSGSLLSGRSQPWGAGFLSGLLVGAEIGGQKGLASGGEVPLIGSNALSALYVRGFERIGVATRMVDATDATLAGLKAARGLSVIQE